MSTTNKKSGTQVCMYGPGIVFTVDEVSKKPAVDAATAQKVDKILDAVEKMLKGELAQQPRAKSLMEELEELAAMYERDARRQGINPFPEAPSRDYDARNPHKRREDGGEFKVRKDGKFGYETPEDRVTVPARLMQDSARRYRTVCEESESAYASRNPHKGKESRATEARDSARRPMSIYEEVEAAYAARNPHKNK